MSRTIQGGRAAKLALIIAAALLGAALLPVPAADASAAGDDDPGAAPSSEWCERIATGPGGRAPVAVDLSAAHDVVREFSVSSTYATGDQALAGAVTGDDPFGSGLGGVLRRYDDALGDVCALPATDDGLDPAAVKMAGTVALVTPGEGDVHLPDEATVAVVDLRDLPAADGAGDAVRRAVGAARAHDLPGPARFVRSLYGPTDEGDNPSNLYSTDVRLERDGPVIATGSSDRPIVFLTGRRTAPDAAALAGALRLAGEAWILGQDLAAATAETVWRGVGDEGVAVRARSAVTETGDPEPVVAAGQAATQDDPADPASTTYRYDITVAPGTLELSVTIDGADGDDLDLYLLHDADGDGAFTYPDEVVARSTTGSADELVPLIAPAAGAYQVWVHGGLVQGATASFDLTTDITSGSVWPDVIPRDGKAKGRTPRQLAAAARHLVSAPPVPVAGDATRSLLQPVQPFGQEQPVVTSVATLRAALLVAHGLVRRFYPYFDVVGDTIDPRLLETLAEAETSGTDRVASIDTLRRFTEAVHDNHASINDRGTPPFVGYLPVVFDTVNGRPAIRRSLVEGMNPGDVVTAIDGRPIDEVIAAREAGVSGATPGARRYLTFWRLLTKLAGPTTYTLEDPDGVSHTVTVQPEPLDRWLEVDDHPYPRESGPLTDVGAPNLYFLNMSYGASDAETAIDAIGQAVAGHADGLVIDMRHYPPGRYFEVVRHLITSPAFTSYFGIDRFTGPDGAPVRDESRNEVLPAGAPSWDGPIVLLTDHGAISAAESFMQVLVGAGRVTAVVGRTSGGTTGDRTSALLPGGYLFRYTPMHVLNPDGSRFHGVGIVADHPVEITATDLRDGIDRDVLTAIDVLNGTGG